ncbi:hypothetical protein [Thioalkalivibrio sp. XN279]|uniref:hypothetical protein n=1 Tax=Thioalkalivibrio sp. XN279 TaxID=2714953 RepID=UPI001409ACA8|nr:hypothetical protein [Thioalkalivibrio sp. XN279]NHA15085.1 hypothetical protein [Thioalkalivibrio sp. XN279]
MRVHADVHRVRVPLRLVLVDAAGAVLAAIGILDLLDTGPQLLPASWPEPLAAISLLVFGCLMMAALPVWLLRRRHERRSTVGRPPA